MDKNLSKTNKPNLDSKRTTNTNLHRNNQHIDSKKVETKINRMTNEDIIEEVKKNPNFLNFENGVTNSALLHRKSSLLEYLNLTINALNSNIEKYESMKNSYQQMIDSLDNEIFDLEKYYNYNESMMKNLYTNTKSDISKIDEEIKQLDYEIEKLDKYQDSEELKIVDEITNEIEKEVKLTENLNVNR